MVKLVELLIWSSLFLACFASHGVWPQGDGTDMLVGGCEFFKHNFLNANDLRALRKLKPLVGKIFSTQEKNTPPGRKPYRYDVGICTQATNVPLDNTAPRVTKDFVTYDVASVLQWNNKRPDEPANVLGTFNETEIMSGSDWVTLIYSGGDRYRHKCNDEGRRSIIMIMCDFDEKEGKLRLIEENYNKTEDCFYLFELDHAAVCPVSARPSKFSVGSILCLVLVGVILLYLILGCLVQRFCLKARGTKQMPNMLFWQNCGHLAADGCDLVCRCGAKADHSSYQDLPNKPPVNTVNYSGDQNTETTTVTNGY